MFGFVTAMDTKLIFLVALFFAAAVVIEGQPKQSNPPKKPPMTKKCPCKSEDTPAQCEEKQTALKDNQDLKHLNLYNEWIHNMMPAHKATWKTTFPEDAKTYEALATKFG